MGIKNTDNASSIAYKKLLGISLIAMTLGLSACDERKSEATMEGSALEFDSETSEAEAAAEVAAASAPMIVDREDNPVVPSQDRPDNTGAVAEGGDIVSEDMSNEDVGTAYINSDDSYIESDQNMDTAYVDNNDDIEIVEESSTY